MANLSVSINELKGKDVSSCLNVGVYDTRFEGHIKTVIKDFFKSHKRISLKSDEELELFLEYTLLRISGLPMWQSLQEECDLDQDSLYALIRKNLYLTHPEIRF